MQGRELHVDTQDVQNLIETMRLLHTKDNFNKIMFRAFKRAGATTRRIIADEVSEDYVVQKRRVKREIGNARMRGGSNVSCTIPIQGVRHSIGGGFFGARGGAQGWAIPARGYRIRTQIIRGRQTMLPAIMGNIGDGRHKPFRNTAAPGLHGVAFVRKGDERLPIQKITGIAVPQMPLNLSRSDIQEEIISTLVRRIEHEHNRMIRKCRR